MNESGKLESGIKTGLTVFMSVLFSLLLIVKFRAAIALSVAILVIPSIYVVHKIISSFFEKRNISPEKRFLTYFLFFYPLLPSLWGLNLGAGIPVLRAHRIAIIILIIYLFKRGRFFNYYTDFFKSFIFTNPIIFIIISMFLSSFFSNYMGTSIFFSVSFIVESLILSVVVFSIYNERNDFKLLANAICYSTLILCVFAMYENFTQFNIYSIFGVYSGEFAGALSHQMRSGDIRIIGPFFHSIAFGSYLALTLPMFMLKFRNNLPVLGATVLLILGTVLATQSRSAQIGAIMIIGMYFVLIDRKYIPIMLFFLIPAFLLKPNFFITRFQTLNPFGASNAEMAASSMARSSQIDFYLPYIKQNLFIGYGLGDVPKMMRWIENYSDTVDNFYLLYTFYYGIIGLFTWVFLMLSIIIKPILVFGKSIFRDELLLLILIPCFTFSVINAVVALFSFHFIFWIYLGVLTRLIYIKKAEYYNMQMAVPAPESP